jgi:hypothetical protein
VLSFYTCCYDLDQDSKGTCWGEVEIVDEYYDEETGWVDEVTACRAHCAMAVDPRADYIHDTDELLFYYGG